MSNRLTEFPEGFEVVTEELPFFFEVELAILKDIYLLNHQLAYAREVMNENTI